jgi:hypothetical protein
MPTETVWRTSARDDLAKLIWETDPPDHRRSWDKAYRLADALLDRAGASCEGLRAAMRRALALLEASGAGEWAAANALRDALAPDALVTLRDALRNDDSGAPGGMRAALARAEASAQKSAADWGAEALARRAAEERFDRARAEAETLRARFAIAEARTGALVARLHRAEVERDATRAAGRVIEAGAAAEAWGWVALATRESDRASYFKRQRDESWRETAAAEECERKYRDALRLAEARAGALRAAVEAAPHDDATYPPGGCAALRGGRCNCWKSRALGERAPNEEKP